jgi:hypothetical protein
VPQAPGMDLNPKVKLFSALVDLDCKIDTSDIYPNSWTVDFLKMLNMLAKTNSRLM